MLNMVCHSDVFSRAVFWHGALVIIIIIIIIIITSNLFTRSKSQPYRRIRGAVMCRTDGPVSRSDRTCQGDAW